jgi:hypothetical protein
MVVAVVTVVVVLVVDVVVDVVVVESNVHGAHTPFTLWISPTSTVGGKSVPLHSAGHSAKSTSDAGTPTWMMQFSPSGLSTDEYVEQNDGSRLPSHNQSS